MLVIRLSLFIILAIFFCSPNLCVAEDVSDPSEALSGLKSVKVIFDLRVTDLEKLIFNLELINETLDGISNQKIVPDMIVALRGPGVKLFVKQGGDEEVSTLIRNLKAKGVQFELCAVALRVFKVDRAQIIPEVKVVSNVFNSLIGYQNKGYALIVAN